jgi:hypothetical protein
MTTPSKSLSLKFSSCWSANSKTRIEIAPFITSTYDELRLILREMYISFANYKATRVIYIIYYL